MASRYDTDQTCDKRSAGPRGWSEHRESYYVILTRYAPHGRGSIVGRGNGNIYLPILVHPGRSWGQM
jgi:phosphoenolpyruvate carboxylase